MEQSQQYSLFETAVVAKTELSRRFKLNVSEFMFFSEYNSVFASDEIFNPQSNQEFLYAEIFFRGRQSESQVPFNHVCI